MARTEMNSAARRPMVAVPGAPSSRSVSGPSNGATATTAKRVFGYKPSAPT